MDTGRYDVASPGGSPVQCFDFLQEVESALTKECGHRVTLVAEVTSVSARSELKLRVLDSKTGDLIAGIHMAEEGLRSAYNTKFVVSQLVTITKEKINYDPDRI